MSIQVIVSIDGSEPVYYTPAQTGGRHVVTIGTVTFVAEDRVTLDGLLNRALDALHDEAPRLVPTPRS